MIRGISYVLTACFFWGLIFIIPLLINGFSSFEVALGRYFFFGITSLGILSFKGWQYIKRIPWDIWTRALSYSVIVNIVYYTFLVLGLYHCSAAATALISGCAPISIAICSSAREGWSGLRPLIISCAFMFCGLFLVNFQALAGSGVEMSTQYFLGLLCAFAELGIWTWFVLANAKFMKEHPQLSGGEWTTLLGVATWFWVIFLAVLVNFLDTEMVNLSKFNHYNQELFTYLGATLALAIGASWIGFYFWNSAMPHIPLTLAGQLTIFETLFGLVFVYIYEQRQPTLLEYIGIVLLFAGVITASVSSLRKNNQNAS